MGIADLFTWYQQKIGTYDKQKWETKIEQREQRIYGLNHIRTRNTKPNTNLIDIDLVRGSTFTKAKPNHGFIKVTKLATLRCVFFPFYTRWWIKQTSKYVYAISLFIYISEALNLLIYFVHTPINTVNTEGLSFTEIFIPFIMMWFLSLIHSQIVATAPSTDVKNENVRTRRLRRKRMSSKKQRKSEEKVDDGKQDKPGRNDIDSLKQDPNIACDSISCDPKIEEEKINNNLSTDSDSDGNRHKIHVKKRPSVTKTKITNVPTISITTQDSKCNTEDEALSSPEIQPNQLSGEFTSSATEWMGVTTNSEEDCSYSSDLDNISDSNIENEKCYGYDNDLTPTAIFSKPTLKVCCIIWEGNIIKKADLTMIDISSAIIGKVEAMPESMDYFYIGLVFATILAILPIICRIFNTSADLSLLDARFILEEIYNNITQSCLIDNKQETIIIYYKKVFVEIFLRTRKFYQVAIDGISWEYFVILITMLQRWTLASMVFFMLAIAEKTFKQRLLYAKLFSHLTSSRRAWKSDLPHFRLNRVINIKTWLSVRSYLKKRGPQRSVDVIVSTAFVVTLLLLIFLCVEVLKNDGTGMFSMYHLEALIWCLGLGILLLRFMTLGTKINKKYRNLSVLITEQINLNLQLEQKPHKKEEFNVANNVLKLAIDLLKELENPFKISGLSANPILYNVTKLVILSALSGVFSEMLGFKLKLHKIKLK